MAASASHHLAARRLRQGGTIAVLTASLMLGACGQTLQGGNSLLSANGATSSTGQPQPAPPVKIAAQSAPGGVSDDLLKATDYWGKAYGKNPRELEPALSYARNLKAMGEKRRAMAVLQQVSLYHGQSRELASEYGRLALDLDQIGAAKQLLAIADDPGNPDWRVISARGTVLAKEGKYDEAIPYFERALTLAQDQPSVLSNLALAQAMNGEPGKAEKMLRQAAATDGNSPRIRQNLALVLGLQGKYDEAKLVASRDIPMTKAAENADYLRQVVKLDPKSVPNSDPQASDWNVAAVATPPSVSAVPVEKIADVRGLPPVDAAAAGDTAWVVSANEAPAAPAANPAATAAKVMSISEMAAKFAFAEDDTAAAQPKKSKAAAKPAAQQASQPAAWSTDIAQVKR